MFACQYLSKVAQRIEKAMRGETGGVTEEVASQEVAGQDDAQ